MHISKSLMLSLNQKFMTISVFLSPSIQVCGHRSRCLRPAWMWSRVRWWCWRPGTHLYRAPMWPPTLFSGMLSLKTPSWWGSQQMQCCLRQKIINNKWICLPACGRHLNLSPFCSLSLWDTCCHLCFFMDREKCVHILLKYYSQLQPSSQIFSLYHLCLSCLGLYYEGCFPVPILLIWQSSSFRKL